MTVTADDRTTTQRLLMPSLVFIALVVAAVGSLGAPLITSVAVARPCSRRACSRSCSPPAKRACG